MDISFLFYKCARPTIVTLPQFSPGLTTVGLAIMENAARTITFLDSNNAAISKLPEMEQEPISMVFQGDW